MQEAEKLIKKIIKKCKDKDARYLYGVEYSSDTTPSFKVAITFTKAIPPVVVAAGSKKKMLEALQSFLDGESAKDLAIRYHEEQIELEKRAIRYHESIIRQYEEKQEVNEFENDTPS